MTYSELNPEARELVLHTENTEPNYIALQSAIDSGGKGLLEAVRNSAQSYTFSSMVFDEADIYNTCAYFQSEYINTKEKVCD
ncbi:MAG TPA: hypothetical protein VK982_02475 [Bacteroidales bacterium]|nr:hypothetical protein [Bacteroidales bacterium]